MKVEIKITNDGKGNVDSVEAIAKPEYTSMKGVGPTEKDAKRHLKTQVEDAIDSLTETAKFDL